MKSATAFITDVLIDPETGRPFVLLPSEKPFLKHAFKTSKDGRLSSYPELVYSCPKEVGQNGIRGHVAALRDARKQACRLTVTYAGFEGESELLEDLYKRGLKQEQIRPGSICRRRPADVLDASAGSAVANECMAQANAFPASAECLPAADRE